jgi:hypothetical protein
LYSTTYYYVCYYVNYYFLKKILLLVLLDVVDQSIYDVLVYEKVENGKKIKKAVGVDSQMFILDQNDPISYWHLYFKGSVGRKPCKFFAELSGAGGPQELRICQMVDKAIAGK